MIRYLILSKRRPFGDGTNWRRGAYWIEGANFYGDSFHLSSDSLAIKDRFWFKKNFFYVVELESPLELGTYHIKMEFESELRDQPLSGLYRLDYKRKDGTKV